LDSRVGLLEENKADKRELEDILLLLRGSDGESGIIKKCQETKDSIDGLKGTIFKIYTPILTGVTAFLTYLIINHVLEK
jgi:hypothetical protein